MKGHPKPSAVLQWLSLKRIWGSKDPWELNVIFAWDESTESCWWWQKPPSVCKPMYTLVSFLTSSSSRSPAQQLRNLTCRFLSAFPNGEPCIAGGDLGDVDREGALPAFPVWSGRNTGISPWVVTTLHGAFAGLELPAPSLQSAEEEEDGHVREFQILLLSITDKGSPSWITKWEHLHWGSLNPSRQRIVGVGRAP